jgi:uncharacterized membrane protein YkvA (DUF1232 family)
MAVNKKYIKQFITFIPDLLKLLKRLYKDVRVPEKYKWLFPVVIIYVISPLDIIPDWIPVLGQSDDLVLVILFLDKLMADVPKKVFRQHWDGEVDLFEFIDEIKSNISKFIPTKVFNKIKKKLKIN